ncbi:hypothetical protein [Pelotalea chapellei]|uniref:Paar repeat-containing protein n=1 Tax=Pelotalea chapellei TaxID=44671 RepID=A0ABS5UAU2_9BACT|nr:hypothetical protein [Pelotalea chapellei]MBT1072775.1 hypothetical protein [Pelotalea chapellei]
MAEIAGKRKQAPGGLGRHKTGPKPVDIKMRQEKRIDENKQYLENSNVKAFLSAIAEAESGDYNFEYGAVKGKKNDKWRFSDFSTHPGPGYGGVSTPAGRYQITRPTWRQLGGKLGLTDFSPTTQDLMAIEMLRELDIIDEIVSGDIDSALSIASHRWAALPQGPGKPNRHPPQPYMKYDKFVATYKNQGGNIK